MEPVKRVTMTVNPSEIWISTRLCVKLWCAFHYLRFWSNKGQENWAKIEILHGSGVILLLHNQQCGCFRHKQRALARDFLSQRLPSAVVDLLPWDYFAARGSIAQKAAMACVPLLLRDLPLFSSTWEEVKDKSVWFRRPTRLPCW